MALQSITNLKEYFVTGALPSEENFADLIDSCANAAVTNKAVLDNIGDMLGQLTYNNQPLYTTTSIIDCGTFN